jgi:GTP cyclohydrolase I
MLDKNKINGAIGSSVNEFLVSKGVETPMKELSAARVDSKKTTSQIAQHCKAIMELQGLNLSDDSLMDTPLRWAKVLSKEKFYGLNYDNFPKCTTVINKTPEDSDLVIIRDIELNSLCEHHYEPIIGKVQIAYIPGENILGLSKFNRIVDFFGRRPQIQERLTKQIFYALQHILKTDDIAVIVDAEHMCVKTRGVLDGCSDTVTSKMGGLFKSNDPLRAELFAAISINRK